MPDPADYRLHDKNPGGRMKKISSLSGGKECLTSARAEQNVPPIQPTWPRRLGRLGLQNTALAILVQRLSP